MDESLLLSRLDELAALKTSDVQPEWKSAVRRTGASNLRGFAD